MSHPARAGIRPLLGLLSPRHTKKVVRSLSCAQLRQSSSSNSKVLGQTTLLLQDGLEIYDLPLVIRRMSAAEYPFCSKSYSGHLETTAQEDQFQRLLQACDTLPQVFSLLEIPGDRVSPYSAAFALQRLHQLNESSRDAPDSFIRRAIFHELCGTATRDIQLLSTDTVIALVKCYLNSKSFKEEYKCQINDEIETRIGDSSLTISEICTFIQVLSEAAAGSSDLVSNLWTHLAARYQDMNEENIGQVFSVLRNICPQHRYILKVLDKQVVGCWWKLSAADVTTMSQALLLVNHKSHAALPKLGKWLFCNIHEVTDQQLRPVIGAFNYFHFKDLYLMKALQRYITARNDKLENSLAAVIMEYCLKCKVLSPAIYDTISEHFVKNHASYDVDEIYYVLRPFGQLNYVPSNSAKLFMVVEEMLQKRFEDFLPHRVLELLVSFVYIKRIPSNFVPKIFNHHFMLKLKEAPNPNSVNVHLRQLRAAVRLDVPGSLLTFPHHVDFFPEYSHFLTGQRYRFHKQLGSVLQSMNRDLWDVLTAHILPDMPYFVDYLLDLNAEKQTSWWKRKKLAVLTVMPEDTCVNSQHPLGPNALLRRHLTIMGYTVLEVHYEDFMWKASDQTAYMTRRLAPHVPGLNSADTEQS